MINVLRGEMSLVGPRPLPLRDYERLEPWHRRRYNVLPGMTGLWQIAGPLRPDLRRPRAARLLLPRELVDLARHLDPRSRRRSRFSPARVPTRHEQVRESCLRLHDPDRRAPGGDDQAASSRDPAQLLAPRAPRGRRRLRDDRGAGHDGRRARLPGDLGSESRRHHRQGRRARLLQQRRRVRAVAFRRPSRGRRLGNLRRAHVSPARPRRRPAGDRLRRRRSGCALPRLEPAVVHLAVRQPGPSRRRASLRGQDEPRRSRKSASTRPSLQLEFGRSTASSWRSSRRSAKSGTGSSDPRSHTVKGTAPSGSERR